MMEDAHEATWSVAEAKARFSELIETAERAGPQTIHRRGREVAVVVPAEEWHRKATRSGSIAEFFAASPLRGSGLQVERAQATPGDVALPE